MYTKKYLLSTLKEKPAQTKTISHQLMLRAGIIRMLSAGIYTWLPTGYRVIKKITKIIQKIMNEFGALEICLPLLQPKKFWDQSGRNKLYGAELIKIINRRKKQFVLSPTHEEVITYIMNYEINSYKQLPIIFYQIQKKFRDEKRPQFGIIRSVEFLMKDAYSFHINNKSLKKTYHEIFKIYLKIFNKLNLIFHVNIADATTMGGSISHEFNAIIPKKNQQKLLKNFNYIQTKEIKIFFICTKNTKNKYPYIALIINSEYQINIKKLKNISIINQPIKFLEIKKFFPKIGNNLNIKNILENKIYIIADTNVKKIPYFVIEKHKNLNSILWNQDIFFNNFLDISNINNDEIIINNNKNHSSEKKIEIGHIFQLNTKYSEMINKKIKNKTGKNTFMHMGCYGIGINRIIAAIIEQNHDHKGILWPSCIAPFQVFIIPIKINKSNLVKKYSKLLYKNLKNKNIETLFDNRSESFGKMFADMNLIGIPHGIIINLNSVKKKYIEYYSRVNNCTKKIKITKIIKFLQKTIK
ncbi:prolyl-tRNA synthetase [Buchnera aphidicola (Cinara tujafilina)]|uniref:Proline--tRNA ligase n=1 Tax=Buchnera aphidicola (Cinara tujafilina) TaxID=261317 RepID=F7WZ87_9GAMM|nr:aminoacyl--tRNA ligase-related protein [Buchnera aphidicola]AEH39741.1 prolyl-tRNA synthetase [Buchnera aphidicola (Cinara tujafilina)]